MKYPTTQEIRDQSREEWLDDYNGNPIINNSESIRKPLQKGCEESKSDPSVSSPRTEKPDENPGSVTSLKVIQRESEQDERYSRPDDRNDGRDDGRDDDRNDGRNDDRNDGRNDHDDLRPPPILEPGSYIGICTGSGLRPFREGEDKLFFNINVRIDNGNTVTLERWYNVQILKNPEQGAGFRVGLCSDCRREFIAVIPEAGTWRLDRFFPSKLIGLTLNVRVRPTTYDMKREEIPEGAQYSVIAKILSIADKE